MIQFLYDGLCFRSSLENSPQCVHPLFQKFPIGKVKELWQSQRDCEQMGSCPIKEKHSMCYWQRVRQGQKENWMVNAMLYVVVRP